MPPDKVRDAYVEAVETENEILRERVIELEELLGFRLTVPLIFGLTGQEAKLFGFLLKREIVTKEQSMTALYTELWGEKEREIKIVDVFICKMRSKLKKFGITIETVWGRGYRMTPEVKALVEGFMVVQGKAA